MNKSNECGQVHDLHLYLDGELPLNCQVSLFSHMSGCGSCRSLMESVLTFRRMIRQEYVSIPPVADDTFFSRLADLKMRDSRVNRDEDRNSLWNLSRSVSLRVAILAAVAVFIVGLLFPTPLRIEYVTPLIKTEVERVKFPVEESIMYVFYPGIDVVANRTDSVDK
jgi:anti-sigma factor RsiW